MKLVKVSAASVNQTPFDWEGNEARVRGVIAEARQTGATLLCLPELVLSGYGCEDVFHMPHVQELSWNSLINLLPSTAHMVVAVGLPLQHQGVLFNAVAVVVNQNIVAIVPKKSLAGDGVHYEQRWFKAWSRDIIEIFERDNISVPIGDLYLDIGGIRVGFEICEEAWGGDRPGSSLSHKGVDVILNPSASHFAFGKRQVRERLICEGSRAFHVAYLYSNLLGNESGRIVFDGGSIVASEGKLIAVGSRFSAQDFVVTSAVVDIDANRLNKTRSGSYKPQLGKLDRSCVDVPFAWPEVESGKQPPVKQQKWETSSDLKAEEFTRAVALGLFDYLRKSKLSGYTVSLSGGVDSAATVLLASLSLKLVFLELGLNKLKERLNHIKDLSLCDSIEKIIFKMITTVYQSTANSSDATQFAAEAVAKAVGCRHYRWDVNEIVESYKKLLSQALKVDLNWALHDISLQNIQARSRSPSVWMLANLNDQLLLSTSNRSEAAVGYATMDGDTSGGLAPIAGIDKDFLRTWLSWMEKTGPEGIGPEPKLKAVNEVPPTAELRPRGQNQTDENDLMPYTVLDAIEKALIRDKKSPREILNTLSYEYPEYSRANLVRWVRRFVTLWCRNQWKRERFAVSFHLDDLNLDPKSWCRFPVLSGGFERELQELE